MIHTANATHRWTEGEPVSVLTFLYLVSDDENRICTVVADYIDPEHFQHQESVVRVVVRAGQKDCARGRWNVARERAREVRAEIEGLIPSRMCTSYTAALRKWKERA